MNNTSKEKFISQCTAMTPCPDETNHQMNEEGTGCKICKLTIQELQQWETMEFDEKERICNEILER